MTAPRQGGESGAGAERRKRPCEYPVVERSLGCCGDDPCSLEWRRPCEDQGGCLDRSTCGDCAEPMFKGTSADGSLSIDDAIAGVVDLFPGADKQALRCLADLLRKPPTAAAVRDAEAAGIEWVASEARRYAGHYPPNSDGQNTFVMLAENAERKAAAIRAAAVEREQDNG